MIAGIDLWINGRDLHNQLKIMKKWLGLKCWKRNMERLLRRNKKHPLAGAQCRQLKIIYKK
jgi:hypothetical protein